MAKKWKVMVGTMVLSLIIAIGASLTAFAASPYEKTFTMANGASVTVNNIIEVEEIENFGYGETRYIVKAPVTITFHGELDLDKTNVAKWVDEEGLYLVDVVDNVATLTEPTDFGYGIFPVFQGQNFGDNQPILLFVVADDGETADEVEPAPSTEPAETTDHLLAQPTTAKVLVNGVEVRFEAYNIDDNNYFKLRDLAMALTGSEKNFDIGWDAEANAISLTSGTAYTAVGNELALSGDSNPKGAVATTSAIYLDGEEVSFTAYNINDNNYFKLRDVARAFNIGVGWDADTKTITIDTSEDYSE